MSTTSSGSGSSASSDAQSSSGEDTSDTNAGEGTSAETTDPTTGDPCSPDPCLAPEVCVDGVCIGAAAPGPGELLITEFQPDPALVTDDQGEWFELLNVSATALELQGCVLSDQDSDSHTIASSVVIEPGALAVLGRVDVGNGGVTLDYAYGGQISLANGDDELVLTCDGVRVDEVVWTEGWPFGAGIAAQLDPAAVTNDDPGSWCQATAPYGDGDLGTPGAANMDC